MASGVVPLRGGMGRGTKEVSATLSLFHTKRQKGDLKRKSRKQRGSDIACLGGPARGVCDTHLPFCVPEEQTWAWGSRA